MAKVKPSQPRKTLHTCMSKSFLACMMGKGNVGTIPGSADGKKVGQSPEQLSEACKEAMTAKIQR